MAAAINGVAAPDAAEVNLGSEEAAGLVRRRLQTPNKGGCMDCTTDPTATTADEKDPFPGYAARAAMVGACLYRLDGGGYLLGRWGWARELPDLRAVAHVLRLIDGRSA